MNTNIFIVFIILNLVTLISPMNVILKAFNSCPNTNTDLGFVSFSNIRHVGNYVHQVDLKAIIGIVIGDNVKYRVNLYKNKRKLPVAFNGKDGCKGLETMIGEVYTDVLKQANYSTTCPLEKGKISVKNVEMDMKKIKLMLPVKGEFRVEIQADEIATNKFVACLEIVADLK